MVQGLSKGMVATSDRATAKFKLRSSLFPGVTFRCGLIQGTYPELNGALYSGLWVSGS